MNLSRKLILVFLVITIPPIMASMIFTFWEVSARLELQTLEQLKGIATKQGTRIDSFFMKWTEKTNDFSSRGELRVLLGELQKEGTVENDEKISSLLSDYKEGLIEVDNIFVINKEGVIFAAPDSDFVGESISTVYNIDKELLQESVSVIRDQSIGGDYATGIFFSSEIKNEEEELFLVMQIETSEIIAIARDYSALGKTGETVLGDVTNKGEVIFLSPLRFDSEYHDKEKVNFENKNIPIVQALEGKQKSINDLIDYRGEEVLAVTKYMDLSGWGIVVKIDKDEALTILSELKRSYMVVAVVSLILVSIAAWYYARMITRPIVDLSKTTKEIALSKNFKSRVEVRSKDELGQLAVNFNAMFEELEGSYGELESRVRDRTGELDQNIKKLKRMNKVMLGRELKMIELKKEIKKHTNKNKTV